MCGWMSDLIWWFASSEKYGHVWHQMSLLRPGVIKTKTQSSTPLPEKETKTSMRKRFVKYVGTGFLLFTDCRRSNSYQLTVSDCTVWNTSCHRSFDSSPCMSDNRWYFQMKHYFNQISTHLSPQKISTAREMYFLQYGQFIREIQHKLF